MTCIAIGVGNIALKYFYAKFCAGFNSRIAFNHLC